MKMKMVKYVADDATFKGAEVGRTKTHISIDTGRGVAHLPLDEGKIYAMRGSVQVTEAVTKQKSAPVIAVKKARKARTNTKMSNALDIYDNYIKNGRDAVIANIMADLDMSLAGATTYFYNCKKLRK